MRITTTAAALILPLFITACAAPVASLRTVAEASNYTETARYSDVTAFLNTLAQHPNVNLDSIGTTVEGRDIPVAIIADPPVTSPDDIRDDRVTILLFGNIHAGEVCGKEALCMLARDIVHAPVDTHDPRLDQLVLLVVPIYNADGNERFSPLNRPGQVGPNEMGTRANAQGYDLNRDYIKLDAPETRALVNTLNTWDPHVIVDTHTTNGSHHRYVLTYQGPKHPAGDPSIVTYVRDTMLPAVDAAFETTTGEDIFFYGNFADIHTKWRTYPAEPRYGVAYRGMRNRLSILSEAYSYATYQQRVNATYHFCNEILTYSANHHDEIRALTAAADQRTTSNGHNTADAPPLPVRINVRAFERPTTVLGYEEYNILGERTEPSDPRDYDVEFVNDFYAEETVALPAAYLIPANLTNVITHLRRHGITVEQLDAPATFTVETYTLTGVDFITEYEQHTIVSLDVAQPTRSTTTPRRGSHIVRTAQSRGTLAAYLLEPRSTDGLATWNFLDNHLQAGSAYPIQRVIK